MPTPRHPRATVIVLLIGLSSVIQITGCSRPLNQSDQLLGTSPLSALEPEESISWVEVAPLTAEPTDAEAMAGTSIAPLDRSMATPLIIRIQQAQVEHEPTYLSTRPVLASSTRADDSWPQLQQALEVDTNDGNAALDGLIEPFRPLVSLLISPISVIIEPPFKVMVGPSGRSSRLAAPRYPAPWRWVKPIAERPDDDET